jgi:hypothetical protein
LEFPPLFELLVGEAGVVLPLLCCLSFC